MKATKGFTLIELMVVVVIVSILAAVAIPSYSQYVIRANRSAAQQFMLDVASRAEQYRLDARNYPSALGTGAGQLNVTVPDDVSPYYTVTLGADNVATPPIYTITATPVAGSRQVGQSTLTLNSAGIKAPAAEW
jgi:type IV pilus assembly protein PilE